jgi:hypothetical protein
MALNRKNWARLSSRRTHHNATEYQTEHETTLNKIQEESAAGRENVSWRYRHFEQRRRQSWQIQLGQAVSTRKKRNQEDAIRQTRVNGSKLKES